MRMSSALQLIVPTIFLCGCVGNAKPEQDYSPGYSYVATGPGGSDKSTSGSILAPNACLNEPVDDDNPPSASSASLTQISGVGSHLPPGCANAYNLQRMVESQRDLVEGRRMGPAAAAPTARAARRYLEGEQPSEPLGGAFSGDAPRLPTN
ncbi:hypothetical protein [Mesorhizobium retamae]|uniref:Pilus assembly protein n=1 Tax=Mesorhizobium retamae TaxID=2912854 RepID=A0ABS9Q853_9HYPH|nr:hypothetical protein [Mesorhizobium sp. IRAMC:0171]MCG7503597.1 hypothetical protein [Mesorhizobium sp. IRAMC:0171]